MAASTRRREGDARPRAPSGTGPLTKPLDTRARLLDAAERLFAERGIDAVSLREVTRESGARNAIALQYHFSDRAGVVLAILAAPVSDETRRLADERDKAATCSQDVLLALR